MADTTTSADRDHSRVLLIGFDAGDSRLLQAWMDDGRLPNMAKLRDNGAWGYVSQPAGYGSGAVWPSFATGMNPAKHGYYFYRQLDPASYEMQYVEPHDFSGEKPMWDRLSDGGRSVAVFDLPKLGLSTDIDGIMAVDWIAHGPVYHELRTYPEELGAELIDRFGGDPLPKSKCDYPGMRTTDEHRELLDHLIDRVGQRERCTLHYLAQRDWDFFSTVFADTHCVGHQQWHVRDADHPLHDAVTLATLGDPVFHVYRAIDESIGNMVAAVDDDVTVIVFSATGMGPNYTGNFVLDEVLLRIDDTKAAKPASLLKKAKLRAKRFVPRELRMRSRRLKRRIEEKAQTADRAGRKSYPVPHNDISGAIRLNIAGREPQGRLQPSEVDAYIEHLRTELLALRNADTGGPVVDDVVRLSDESQGDHLHELPDLFVIWNRDAPIDRVRSDKVGTVEYVHRGNRTGDHRAESLFLASGPGVIPGEVNGTTIYDFAPTIGALAGVPIDDTDGATIAAIVGVGAQPAST